MKIPIKKLSTNALKQLLQNIKIELRSRESDGEVDRLKSLFNMK